MRWSQECSQWRSGVSAVMRTAGILHVGYIIGMTSLAACACSSGGSQGTACPTGNPLRPAACKDAGGEQTPSPGSDASSSPVVPQPVWTVPLSLPVDVAAGSTGLWVLSGPSGPTTLAKIDQTGNQAWSSDVLVATDADLTTRRPRRVAVGPDGTSLVLGISLALDQYGNGTPRGIWWKIFDPDGVERSLLDWPQPFASGREVLSVTAGANPAGGFVVATSVLGSTWPVVFFGVDAGGQVLWSQEWDAVGAFSSAAELGDLRVDASGIVLGFNQSTNAAEIAGRGPRGEASWRDVAPWYNATSLDLMPGGNILRSASEVGSSSRGTTRVSVFGRDGTPISDFVTTRVAYTYAPAVSIGGKRALMAGPKVVDLLRGPTVLFVGLFETDAADDTFLWETQGKTLMVGTFPVHVAANADLAFVAEPESVIAYGVPDLMQVQ